MRHKRPLILDILPWLHALLLFAGIYPFIASLVLFKGSAFWRITSACILLLIPIISSWLLLQRIQNVILFMTCSIFISAATSLVACCWSGFGETSGSVCAVITFFCSLVIFCVRAYTKASYGRMKQNFYEVHKPEVPFEVQEREIPSIMNRPQPYHWAWLTLLYLPRMLLHFTTYLYIMFGILFVDVFLCLGYHYISSLYEYVRENQRVASLPVATMQKIHRMTGIIGALLLFLFLLPALLYGREFEPDLTTDKPLLTYEDMLDEGPRQPSDPEISNKQILAEINSQIRETPKWLRDLTRILGYVFAVGIILGIVIAIIHSIRRFGKDFAVEEEDEVVFLESERDAELADNAGMQALHDAYEKARYSENGCTREDMNAL